MHNSQQLGLDLFPPAKTQNESVISGVQKNTKQALTPSTEGSKFLKLNGKNYEIKIARNTKNKHSITYNENTGVVEQVIVTIKPSNKAHVYVFEIGIKESESKNMYVTYINKTDKYSGGPKFLPQGKPIVSFNYFRYLFGEDTHDKIVEQLKQILLELNKEKQ